MPPAKRSLLKPEKIVVFAYKNKSKDWYCSTCTCSGTEIYEKIYSCNKGVNAPFGNHSIIGCIYYKQKSK